MQDSNTNRFVAIASLHSELVAINTNGQLCQWKWNEMDPYTNQDVCYLSYFIDLTWNVKACNITWMRFLKKIHFYITQTYINNLTS